MTKRPPKPKIKQDRRRRMRSRASFSMRSFYPSSSPVSNAVVTTNAGLLRKCSASVTTGIETP